MEKVSDTREIASLEERLNSLDGAFRSWNSNETLITGSNREVISISKFVEEVAQVQQLLRDLQACQPHETERNVYGLVSHGRIVLHNAMIRLGQEFTALLHQSQSSEPIFTSFRSRLPDDFSVRSFDREHLQEMLMENGSPNSEEYLIDLINPVVLSDIKSIVRVMFLSGYEMECCQFYISARKDALEEWLSILPVENLSIEEVACMEWGALSLKIGGWIKVLKNLVRVYLAREKHLCDLIFGDLSESASRDCFSGSANNSMMQLLSFADGVALGTPSIEKLFGVLEIYNTLVDLLPDIETLNIYYFGSCMMRECRGILSRLGDRGKGIFLMLKGGILKDSSPPPADGDVQRITRYVMNYIQIVACYENSISLTFNYSDGQSTSTLFSALHDGDPCNTFSLGEHLVSILAILESILEKKSSSYPSSSLQHFFMMNNLCYMVRKVREEPALECLIGDAWIRDHMGAYRRCAILYVRTSWAPVLSALGEGNAANQQTRARNCKKKLKKFNRAFEELYKVQTGWKIPDDTLRKELVSSITQKAISAYRSFLGRYKALDDEKEKHTKYSLEDIENKYLWDLFEGSPKSLPSSQLVWRR